MSTLDAKSAQDLAARLTYNQAGLIPAIAQQADTGEVLMMAWMNVEAVVETLVSINRCCR